VKYILFDIFYEKSGKWNSPVNRTMQGHIVYNQATMVSISSCLLHTCSQACHTGTSYWRDFHFDYLCCLQKWQEIWANAHKTHESL